MKLINQTIVAPATNLTNQALALIRMSGEESFEIINKLVKKSISKKQDVVFKKLYDGDELVDEVVISTFVGPISFTGEDVVEIACHGGVLNTLKIVNLIINKGARMAEKGEFSQRAFLNNKIDLIQAEGINDLIFAKNELALKIGVKNMSGAYNQIVFDIKNQLLDIISKIQVSIDYPDYDDVEGSTIFELTNQLELIKNNVDGLAKRSKLANKTANGIKTAIVGKTNVGKSSLLNSLLSEDKAIVTDIEGTTRDIVTGSINLEYISLDLIDTAGIRKTEDFVESIGVEKSYKAIEEADLVLFIIDAQKYEDEDNERIHQSIKGKDYIIVVNKTDLIANNEIMNIKQKYNNVVFISALKNDTNELINKLEQMYLNDEIRKNESLILTNADQLNLIENVGKKVNSALESIKNSVPIDMVNIDLNIAWNLLNDLIGEHIDEEIIENIFKKYCLGK